MQTYVQDVLRQNSWLFYKQLVKRGAYLYVCGGTAMAAGVNAALTAIVAKHGSMSQLEASVYLEDLKVRFMLEDVFDMVDENSENLQSLGRYRRDVYGS